MKSFQYLVMAALFAALLSVQAVGAQAFGACAAADDDREVLYQVSTIDALMLGVYDSSYTFGCLKEHGDFGIGTFDGLDGEMIAVDGYYYQIKSDGVAYPVQDNMTAPFPVSHTLISTRQFR